MLFIWNLREWQFPYNNEKAALSQKLMGIVMLFTSRSITPLVALKYVIHLLYVSIMIMNLQQ